MTPPTPNQNPQKPFKWCRVWDAVDKVMISPDYVTRDGTAYWTCHSIPEMSQDLMWNTGLLDKNGVEIFEGDLVEWTSKCGEGKKKHIDVMKWNNDLACYMLMPWVHEPFQANMKVIGNIHEHPELLQKGPEDE